MNVMREIQKCRDISIFTVYCILYIHTRKENKKPKTIVTIIYTVIEYKKLIHNYITRLC